MCLTIASFVYALLAERPCFGSGHLHGEEVLLASDEVLQSHVFGENLLVLGLIEKSVVSRRNEVILYV